MVQPHRTSGLPTSVSLYVPFKYGLDTISCFSLFRFEFATPADGEARGYVYENNPEVDVFGNVPGTTNRNFELRLAINTAQLGRTFQDR